MFDGKICFMGFVLEKGRRGETMIRIVSVGNVYSKVIVRYAPFVCAVSDKVERSTPCIRSFGVYRAK